MKEEITHRKLGTIVKGTMVRLHSYPGIHEVFDIILDPRGYDSKVMLDKDNCVMRTHDVKEIVIKKLYTIEYWHEVDDCADYDLVEVEAYTNEEALELAKKEVKLGKLFKILNYEEIK